MTERHPIIFLGAGPGDPELITVKGQKALAAADVILYAGSLVSPAVLGWARPEAELIDTAPLNLEQITAGLLEAQRSGKKAVRVHSGDTALFSAIQEQLEILEKEDIPCLVIPGVTAAAAAAAALAQELTLPEVTQTVILTRAAGRTPVPEREALHDLARHGSTMVIYLSIKLIDKVVADLSQAYAPETPAVVAYRVSWPDQMIIKGTLADIVDRLKQTGIERQALILVGPALGARHGALKAQSKLYDKTFAHGFRDVIDNESLRLRYKPDNIRLLLIGESPPASGKFFYLSSAMTKFTSLAFEKAHRRTFNNDSDFLEYFKSCGCYLDDLSHIPVNNLNRHKREQQLRDCVDPLSKRIREANPSVIVICLRKIEGYVKEAVNKSGCNPKLYTLPYPGHGYQNDYIEGLASIIINHYMPKNSGG